jgi:hypothetical protein
MWTPNPRTSVSLGGGGDDVLDLVAPLVEFADARGSVGLRRERLSQKKGDTNPIPRVIVAKWGLCPRSGTP